MPRAPLLLPEPRLRPLVCLSRRRVSEHRVFDVFEGTWRREDGTPLGPFATFDCPDWCNVVAITEASELVLVWQHRFGTDALSLELPGGVIDRGESPEEGARRELREETGYDARTFAPLIRVQPNPALQGNVSHSFIAEGARAVGAAAFDENEECELLLVPVARARELLAEAYVTHALSVVALQALLLRGDTLR
jgi:ADP-ribose pyrophosphatase